MQNDMQCSYNQISAEFSLHSAEQLKHKPSDVRVLDLFAEKTNGIICDIGCGAGQVSRFLRDKGKDVFGMDLSEGMLKEARRLNPDIRFVQGNMKKLPVADGGWGGIVGFFALCHMPRKKIPSIFQEWNRALEPGGTMMLGYHIGNGTFRRTEFYGKKVEIHCTMFMSAEMKHYLSGAGFEIDGWLDRPPYPGFENNNWRGFILARKVDNNPLPSTLWDGLPEVLKGALIGSVFEVEQSLANGASPDAASPDGWTPLHAAASDGRVDIVDVLLRRGASTELALPKGGSALYLAAYYGQLKVCRRLVEGGMDPGAPNEYGNTALHVACSGGHVELAKWLLSLKVDKSPMNLSGETPYIWALGSGCKALSSILPYSKSPLIFSTDLPLVDL